MLSFEDGQAVPKDYTLSYYRVYLKSAEITDWEEGTCQPYPCVKNKDFY